MSGQLRLSRGQWWGFAVFVLTMTLEIMIQNGDFQAPFVVPLLWSLLFCLYAALLVTSPDLDAWLATHRVPIIGSRPGRWAVALLLALHVMGGAVWFVRSRTSGGTPISSAISSAGYQLYVRAETVPLIIRCDGRFITQLDATTPFVTVDVSEGEHLLSAEDPRTGATTFERRVRATGDERAVIVLIPRLPFS